jgi:transcription initiation factor IIE alpha subunit
LEQIRHYTIDLTKIEGNGEFKCPKCGTEISPDDTTENIYTIIETVMKKNRLEKIILQCNKCKSIIHLAGFEFLTEIE